MTNAERFMQRYMKVWPSFGADRLDMAIDPEATIHHPGMESPIRGTDEPDYVRAIKALMPDISLKVANWRPRRRGLRRVRDRRHPCGSVAQLDRDRPLQASRRACDRRDRSLDNLELLAQIDPTVRVSAFAEAAAKLVAGPRCE